MTATTEHGDLVYSTTQTTDHYDYTLRARAFSGDPALHVWVAHPDPQVLADLLPEYQQMWDQYTARWGPSSQRIFGLRQVTGAGVRHLRAAHTGVEDILRQTANTHGMPLPARLRGQQ